MREAPPMPADEKKVDFYMPFFIGDYLSDTSHLSCEEHGAYLLLLFACWKRGGRIPKDPVLLARIAACPQRRWLKVWGIIAHFFHDDGQQLIHRRVVRDLERVRADRSGAVKGGLASAESRRLKNGSAQPGFQLKLPESRQPTRSDFEIGSGVGSEDPDPNPDPDLKDLVVGSVGAGAETSGGVGSDADSRPGENARPASSGATERPSWRWSGRTWYEKFANAWGEWKNRLRYGRGGDRDSRACGELGDILADLPEAEVRQLQDRAGQMFKAYFSDPEPAKSGHSWTWFVMRFNKLRDEVGGGGGGRHQAGPRSTGYAVVRGGKDWSAGMDRVTKR